jgi:hypothetical protein
LKLQYNTEELIKTIKRACSVPTSQLTYTDEDFSSIANDCLKTEVVPLIMATREEYFVTYEDVESPVSGVIPIPEAAVGAKLRSVCFKQSATPLVLANLPRIDLDVVAGVGAGNISGLTGFYIQGNDIILYPGTTVPANTNIRLYYYGRSLDLAAPAAYGRIQSIDTGSNTVVLDFVPYDWAEDTVLNAVSSTPNFKTVNTSLTITAVSSPSVVLDNVADLTVGDYLSEQGWSAIPQIPVEAHNYLAQLTAVKCLEGLGDREGMAAAAKVAKSLHDNLLIMISQRVDGSVKKIIAPDGGLRLWSGVRRFGRWGR